MEKLLVFLKNFVFVATSIHGIRLFSEGKRPAIRHLLKPFAPKGFTKITVLWRTAKKANFYWIFSRTVQKLIQII